MTDGAPPNSDSPEGHELPTKLTMPTPLRSSLPGGPENRVDLWAVPDDAGTPLPEELGHVSGVHWWDPDRRRHLSDLPRFCPSCGNSVQGDGGLAVEYWEADERVYHTWCRTCGWTGDIVRVTRMIGHEPEDHG